MPGRHLGKRIELTDLPEDCQRLVNQYLLAESMLAELRVLLDKLKGKV
jgi:hypothetical protein